SMSNSQANRTDVAKAILQQTTA
ncbi:hypothetical protein, partial [Shigella sp. SHS-8]